MTEEKVEIEETPCPWCKQTVRSYWTKQGLLSRPSITLVADWIYHSVCWDELMKEHPL